LTDAWDSWGPQQDIYSVKVLNSVLDADPPNLVVLNGDLITGENAFLENSTVYLDKIVGPMVQRNLPWASTYGNHDSQFNLSRDAILEREHTWPNALTQSMVPGRDAGVSNYFLPVYPSSSSCLGGSQCDHPALLLWFFDSRGGDYFQETDATGGHVGQPDWVDVSVVRWFQETNAQLTRKHGRAIPSLAFVHIPTNASQAFQTAVGWQPHHQPGVNDDYILAQQGQGWCADGSSNDDDDGGDGNESCGYGGQDVPFMQAITSTPGLMALFSGHDHGDTWCYKWDGLLPGMTVAGNGINLCFGQHSGYGGYGNWIRGARQVLVTEDMLRGHEVNTWIRLESGQVVGSVTLNATYNEDYYPATPDSMTHCPTCNYIPLFPLCLVLKFGSAHQRQVEIIPPGL
jgi:hypothetical protein